MRVESPFPAWAWPLVWQWMQSFRARVCDDFSPETYDQFARGMTQARPGDTWAVYRDEDLGGMIWLPRISPVLSGAHVTFSRPFWGLETTVPAARAAFAPAFESGTEKICATVFADNHQVRAFARALGFREEGVRRSHTQRGGRLVDMVELGVLKEDFYANWSRTGNGDLGSSVAGGRPPGRPEADDPAVDAAAASDAEAGGGHPIGEAGEPR